MYVMVVERQKEKYIFGIRLNGSRMTVLSTIDNRMIDAAKSLRQSFKDCYEMSSTTNL